MENKFLIPSAIIFAGVFVAAAIVYTKLPHAPVNSGTAQVLPSATSASALELLKIRKTDFFLGNPAAKVTVVEYGDFQCPFCGRFFSMTESKLRDSYIKQGSVMFVWRDFPFLGEESFRAAEAARCAGEQGKFWEYHDMLFGNQRGENEGAFNDIALKRFATNLGLEVKSFGTCFDSGKYKTAVKDAAAEAKKLGVSGTPTSFVNGRISVGFVPYEEFKQTIDEELAK